MEQAHQAGSALTVEQPRALRTLSLPHLLCSLVPMPTHLDHDLYSRWLGLHAATPETICSKSSESEC